MAVISFPALNGFHPRSRVRRELLEFFLDCRRQFDSFDPFNPAEWIAPDRIPEPGCIEQAVNGLRLSDLLADMEDPGKIVDGHFPNSE